MQFSFNARQVAPSQPMEPVPEGWYAGVFTGVEQKPVKNSSQQEWYAEFTFAIKEGQFAGRTVKQPRLNLANANEKAREIAARDLSAICHSVNELDLQDLRQLLNKPMQIKFVVRDGYNEAKGYKAFNGTDPAAAAPAPMQPPPQQQPPVQQAAWGAPAAAPVQPPAEQQQAPAQPAWGAPAAPAPQQYAPAPQPSPAPAPQQQWAAGPAPAAAPAGQPAWGAPAQQQPPAQQGFAPPAGGAQGPWGR